MRLILAAAALAVTSLAGCATDTSGAAPDERGGVPTSTPSAETEPVARPSAEAGQPSEEASSLPEGVQAFDQPFTYDNGLTMTVTKVMTFTPDPEILALTYGAMADPIGIKFDVQLKNGTGKPFEPTFVTTDVAAGPDGEQGELYCDSTVGIDCDYSQTLQPGRTRSLTAAVVLPRTSLSDVDIEVSPDFENEPVTWSGALG